MESPAKRPRVLLADDHTMLLEAFQKLLEPECEVVGTAADGRTALEAAVRLRPDVVVLDISMPLLNGLEAGRRLRELLPDAKLVFLTVNEDPDVVVEALTIGASAYLLKSAAASDLIDAIHAAMEGGTHVPPFRAEMPLVPEGVPATDRRVLALTTRQREVLRLVAEGRTMKEIAHALHITQRTVAFHKYRAMQDLGITSTAELVRFAVRHGIAVR